MNAEISFKLKSGSAFAFPLALLGYGLLNIWGLQVDGNSALSQTGAGSATRFLSVSLSYAAALIVFAAFHRHFNTHLTKKPVVLGLGIVGCIGVAALAFAGWTEAGSTALILFGGVATGIARGYLALLWMGIYARLKPRMLLIAFASSLALLSLVEALIAVSGQLPAISMGLLFCLPLLCAFLASASLTQTEDMAADEEEAPSDKTSWSFPYKPVIMLAAYTFVIDFVGGINPSGDSIAIAMVGNALLAVFLFVAGVRFAKTSNIEVLYRLSLPVVLAALLLCLASSTPGVSMLSHCCTGFGFACFITFSNVLLCTICFRYGIDAVWLFGITMAARIPAKLVASNAAASVQTPGDGQTLAIIAVAVALVALSMACASEKDYKTTWGMFPHHREKAPEANTYSSYLNRCSEVARTFGLTHREEEILSMLAMGMNVPAVERALVISKSTAKSHVRHLYAKMGVHSREELVEAVGKEFMPPSPDIAKMDESSRSVIGNDTRQSRPMDNILDR